MCGGVAVDGVKMAHTHTHTHNMHIDAHTLLEKHAAIPKETHSDTCKNTTVGCTHIDMISHTLCRFHTRTEAVWKHSVRCSKAWPTTAKGKNEFPVITEGQLMHHTVHILYIKRESMGARVSGLFGAMRRV